MRDLTPISVPRIQLERLRDVLGERSKYAEQWRQRVIAQSHEEITSDEPAELADFLLELGADLDDWQRKLDGILGQDS